MDSKNHTLITGASAGIGEACAKLLAAEGRNLILVARRRERLEHLKQELEAAHDISVLIYEVDLSQRDQIEDFFEHLKEVEIDVLINNAGFALGMETFDEYAWEDFERMIEVNIKGVIKMAHLAMPHLKKTQGHIVNLSSIAGLEAYEGGSVYCGTKAFVQMISRALRIDLAGTGIRVTDIAPGNVNTEFSTVRLKGDKAAADAKYADFVPLYAKDIAECIAFALSRPKSVDIQFMLVMPTAQASAKRIVKDL